MQAQDLSIHIDTDGNSVLKEIVMGLHWDPPGNEKPADADDLDALCVLFDSQQQVIEVVHPGRPRNASGSVIHTGDSRTGASTWDDERIFVFLEALPEAVAAVSLVVASAQGRAFSDIGGACCHVSDRITEHAWVRLDLTTLNESVAHCVATLRRNAGIWTLCADAHAVNRELLSRLRAMVRDSKARTDSSHHSAAG